MAGASNADEERSGLAEKGAFYGTGTAADTETTDEKDDGVGEGGPSDSGSETYDTGSNQDLEDAADAAEASVSGTITNGEREYVCELNLDFEDTGLISNFDFDWRQIREEDYDEETGLTKAGQYTIAQTNYNSIIDADYDTGITPLRLQYFSEGDENNYFLRPLKNIVVLRELCQYHSRH